MLILVNPVVNGDNSKCDLKLLGADCGASFKISLQPNDLEFLKKVNDEPSQGVYLFIHAPIGWGDCG